MSVIPSTGWKHQVKVIADILIEICDAVATAPVIDVGLIVVVIDVVVDIDH